MHSREFQKTLEFITFCVVLQKGINKKTWTFFVIIETKTKPAGIYLPKGNNRNSKTRCEICAKLTIKTPEPWTYFTPSSSVSIVNFEHVSLLSD